MRPTRGFRENAEALSHLTGRAGPPLLFGLAPRGVYRAADIAVRAVGSYPTVSPLPSARAEKIRQRFGLGLIIDARSPAVYFLWHCPWPDAASRRSAPWRYQARCPAESGLSSRLAFSGFAQRSPSPLACPSITDAARQPGISARLAPGWRSDRSAFALLRKTAESSSPQKRAPLLGMTALGPRRETEKAPRAGNPGSARDDIRGSVTILCRSQ